MKYILFLIFSCFLLLPAEETKAKKIKIYLDFDESLKIAKDSKKNVLMIFSGSDWCNNCQKLKNRVLDSSTFFTFAEEQLIVLEVDFPSDKANALTKEQTKKNEALAEKYNPDGTFPRCVIFSPEGKMIGEIKSYSKETPEEFIKIINDLLAKKK